MTGVEPRPAGEGRPLQGDIVEQVLRDHAALGREDADPELEAVRAAILIEGVFGVRLFDADIDAAVLTDVSAVTALVSRLRRAV